MTPLSDKDLVGEVSGAGAEADVLRVEAGKKGPHVVLLDCGVKHNIIRSLVRRGARVTNLDHAASAQEILDLNPDGVLLCNGPGDPASLPQVVRDRTRAAEDRHPHAGDLPGASAAWVGPSAPLPAASSSATTAGTTL